MNWLDSLLTEMAAHGLAPEHGVIVNGELHRFRVDGDKSGTRNGWYFIHDGERPAAAFGSWRTGEQYKWRADSSSSERAAPNVQQIAAERQQRQAERDKLHVDAAARARRIWDQALEPDQAHRYLRGKAIGIHGIRQHDDTLVVPLRDYAGKLWSLQFIAPDGTKRFLRSGRVKGLFYVVGARTPRIWIAEGFATAASLHEDRGECVVSAFNCGNLLSVAEIILKHWRPQSLSLMADDDWQTSGNPGVTAAKEVAKTFGIEFFIPEFTANRPAWATDFNDAVRLWRVKGVAA